MTRQRLVIANWKLNGSLAANAAWASGFSKLAAPACEVVVCAPFVYLDALREPLEACGAALGAENVSEYEDGAYTGEVSARMLRDVGCRWVIVGHSERRQYFAETDETVNKRTKAALAAGLKPIVCVGELLWERECNITEEVIARQIKLDFFGISADDLKKCVIAYEPVWAIGTGKTATADQAEEVCAFIRATLAKLYGADVAETITVQYGGSMNAKNAAELLSKTNVDGGLIGGASLKAADFTTIITAAVNG